MRPGTYNLRSSLLMALISIGASGFAATVTEDGASTFADPNIVVSDGVIPNLIAAPTTDEPAVPTLIVPEAPKPIVKTELPIRKSTQVKTSGPQIKSVAPGNGEVAAKIYNKPVSRDTNTTRLLTPIGEEFQFPDSPSPLTPTRQSEPESAKRPLAKPTAQQVPLPVPRPPAPKIDEPDEQTEGRWCPQCQIKKVAAAILSKLPLPKKVAAATEPKAPEEPKAASERKPAAESCYGQALLQTAERLQREVVAGHNPTHSHGACAKAVGIFLKSTGFMGPGYDGHYGNAIDYLKRPGQSQGNLEKMGFVNMIGRYDKYNAPPGAVLVFGGPLTASTGGYLPPPGRRRGSPGDYVGHITVKGPGRSSYYTDGHTSEPAIANRYLKGVYVMTTCKTCTAQLKRKCGGS